MKGCNCSNTVVILGGIWVGRQVQSHLVYLESRSAGVVLLRPQGCLKVSLKTLNGSYGRQFKFWH